MTPGVSVGVFDGAPTIAGVSVGVLDGAPTRPLVAVGVMVEMLVTVTVGVELATFVVNVKPAEVPEVSPVLTRVAVAVKDVPVGAV